MCDICRSFPCLSGCPNAEPDVSVCQCSRCKTAIYEGDKIAEIGDKILCEDCADSISTTEWLELLGTGWTFAEAI